MTVVADRAFGQRSPADDDRDLATAEQAAAAFLTALGLDLGGEATASTPRRMAHAHAELLTCGTLRPL